jgi:hypothetical protein
METDRIPGEKKELIESTLQRFLDDLDGPADLQMAIQHGRCQMVYKIISDDLDGIKIFI